MFSGNVRRIATVLTARDNASDPLDEAEDAGDRAADSMDDAEESALSLGKAFGIAAGAATTFGGALALLTRRHGETEQTMARLQVVAGATDEEMEGLLNTAQQIGIDLPISMGDAADAMEQLAFAGFEAEEAISAAHGVANLAVASGMQMGETARTTASQLRMFNLEAEETHQVTAALAATFSSSNADIQELSKAMEMVGGTASMAGISLQEVNAALGVMADEGIRASRAGTALNTTLQRIISGSGQAEEALSKLGLSTEEFTDQHGDVDDLRSILSTIGREMEDVESDAERMAIATELAGQRGARALLPLIENTEEMNEKLGDIFRSEVRESMGELSRLSEEELAGVEQALDMDIKADEVTPEDLVENLERLAEQGEGVDEISQRLETALNVSGDAAQAMAEDIHDAEVAADDVAEAIGGATTASDIAASQMDTAAGMAEFMRSSWDALTFTVFTGAGPAIEWFNARLAGAINLMNENERAAMAVGGTLALLAGAAGAVTLALGAMLARSALVPPAMMLMNSSFIASVAAGWSSAGAIGAVGAAASAATAPVWGLAAAVLGLSTPVLLLVGVFAALVAIWKFDVLGAGDAVGGMFTWVGDKAWWLGEILWELLGIFYELGRISLAGAATAILAPFAAVIRFLENPRRWLEAGKAIPGTIARGISDATPDVLESISKMASEAREYLPFSDARRGAFSDLSESGKSLIRTLVGGVRSEESTLSNTLARVFDASVDRATPSGAGGGAGGAGQSGVHVEFVLNQDIDVTGEGTTEEGVADAAEEGADRALDELENRITRAVEYEPDEGDE